MLEDTFSSLFDDVSDVNQNTTADIMVSLFASPVHFVHTTLDHPDTNRDQEIQDPKDIFKKCKALLAERTPTNSNNDGTYY